VILVLSPDSPQETVDEIVRTVTGLGWTPEISRSPEQIILSLEGTGTAFELESALGGRFEVDVIPIRTPRQARILRSRRTLLTGLATGLGLLTAAGAGIPVVGFLRPPMDTLADPTTGRAGSATRLAVGAARSIAFLGHPVLVIRLDHERFVAFSATCTYMRDCKLHWDADRRQLICPCHGGVFDIHGGVVRGPASTPLSSFAVERIGDELFVSRS